MSPSSRQLGLTLFIGLVLAGCANRPPEEPIDDPLEPVNRAIYKFNDALDRHVLKPVAQGYQDHIPNPVRSGVRNFFRNLHEPLNFVGDVLQAKPQAAATDLTRLIFNSTFGVLGLVDVATDWGLAANDEDFGQVFATWGIGEGWYIVLPFIGPSTARDTVSLPLDWDLDPVLYQGIFSKVPQLTLRVVSDRADLLGATRVLDETAVDPYISVREAYRQARWSKRYDGNPPEPDFFNEVLPP